MKKEKDPVKYYEINDPALESAISEGVMPEGLSIRTILKWTFFISAVVIILIIFSMNLYTYFKFDKEFQAAINTEYHELNNLRETSKQKLNSFELTDEEQGLYRIPVDSAITIIVRDYQ